MAWTSSDQTIVNVDINGVASGLVAGSVTVTATLGRVTQTIDLTVTAATLSGIAVSDSDSGSVALGTSDQLSAIGTYSDATTQDLTNTVSWMASDANVANVNSTGFVTPVGQGNVTITATDGSITQGIDLVVTGATLSSISITDAASGQQIAAGYTDALTAIGTFTDGSTPNLTTTVGWTTSDGTVATVDAATGIVTAVAAGTVIITATDGSVNQGFPITISSATLSSLAVTDTVNGNISVGDSDQLVATGTFSDSTTLDVSTDVTWVSNDVTVVTVDGNGLVQAVGSSGATTTVTATDSLSSQVGSITVILQ